MKDLGFEHLYMEEGVFVNKEKSIWMSVYVDDLIIFGKNLDDVNFLKKKLSEKFKMHDLGELSYILGIRITRLPDGSIRLDQERYMNNILWKFRMENCRSTNIPGEKNMPLKGDGQPVDSTRYKSAIGSLLYLALGTRPDILYAVGVAGCFASDPQESHWNLVKKILHYLKKTSQLGLVYCKSGERKLSIIGYSDADYATDRNDSKSTTGYVFGLNGNIISWYSGKQKNLADSTCCVEYFALGDAAKEGLYLQNLLEELGHAVTPSILVHVDNMAAKMVAENPVFHRTMKHIRVSEHKV